MVIKERRPQTGAATVEYAVTTAIMIGVLFLPMPGSEHSLLSFFLEALRQFQANTSYLLSLP